MSLPEDGADPPVRDAQTTILPDAQAILLHGGQVLMIFEDARAPIPCGGTLHQGGRTMPWIAECWRVGENETWCGLAVLGALPAPDARVHEAGSARIWRLGHPLRVDVAPQPLADFVKRAGVDSRDVFGFLVRHLLKGRPTDSAITRAHQTFARNFFTAAAERDGFIEILGATEGGGIFAQGWSVSLGEGTSTLASVSSDLSVCKVEVALFEREDILPPGHGFCLFGKSWNEETLETVDAVFFERGGKLHRLDVVRGSVLLLHDDATTDHVRHMLPRLMGTDDTARAFKRICRARYQGVDTLSQTVLPIAAAFDSVLQAPDGALLIVGWLLDPLRRVERVILKSTANLYAPLNSSWSPLPRPDLNHGFAANPNFAHLLGAHDVMHGFITHASAEPGQITGAQVYLELVLDDESCLFSPVKVTPFESAERLPQVLAALSPNEPELDRIVEDHLAPFLDSVQPTSGGTRRGAVARPIPLGAQTGARAVSAVMPFRSFAELQPVFGLLAATPDAELLDLKLVTSRAIAADVRKKLGDAFRFYGLRGSLVIASEHETIAGKLDAGVEAGTSDWVLCWMPDALPERPGWLTPLIAAASALPGSALVSPALTYEDGSIYFGGEQLDPSAAHGGSVLSGYGANRLPRGGPEMVSAGAAEVALVRRDLLASVGGFSGHLFSDAYAHVDLATRLRRAGSAAYCAGAVEFWMLDGFQEFENSAFTNLMRQVDSALLQRRNRPNTGDRTA